LAPHPVSLTGASATLGGLGIAAGLDDLVKDISILIEGGKANVSYRRC
jgi:hypothetical protein